MDRFTMYPVAFITTVQPWVAVWVLAISFFITIMVVALLGRDRPPRQLIAMALLGYVATVMAVGLGIGMLSGLEMVEVEVVSVSPRSLTD